MNAADRIAVRGGRASTEDLPGTVVTIVLKTRHFRGWDKSRRDTIWRNLPEFPADVALSLHKEAANDCIADPAAFSRKQTLRLHLVGVLELSAVPAKKGWRSVRSAARDLATRGHAFVGEADLRWEIPGKLRECALQFRFA